MALTLTRISRESIGSLIAVIYDVGLDASYPGGGYVLATAQFGIKNIVALQVEEASDFVAQPAHLFGVRLDRTGGVASYKLRVFGSPAAAAQSTPLLEVAAAAVLTGYTTRLTVYGYS